MIKLKISVTPDILEKSCNCGTGFVSGTNCAIALAVRDVFPRAFVQNEDIWVYGARKNTKAIIRLPKEARKFIRMFDRREPKQRLKMNPIEFEIEIPDNIVKRIKIDELTPLLKNHPTLELV